MKKRFSWTIGRCCLGLRSAELVGIVHWLKQSQTGQFSSSASLFSYCLINYGWLQTLFISHFQLSFWSLCAFYCTCASVCHLNVFFDIYATSHVTAFSTFGVEILGFFYLKWWMLINQTIICWTMSWPYYLILNYKCTKILSLVKITHILAEWTISAQSYAWHKVSLETLSVCSAVMSTNIIDI